MRNDLLLNGKELAWPRVVCNNDVLDDSDGDVVVDSDGVVVKNEEARKREGEKGEE